MTHSEPASTAAGINRRGMLVPRHGPDRLAGDNDGEVVENPLRTGNPCRHKRRRARPMRFAERGWPRGFSRRSIGASGRHQTGARCGIDRGRVGTSDRSCRAALVSDAGSRSTDSANHYFAGRPGCAAKGDRPTAGQSSCTGGQGRRLWRAGAVGGSGTGGPAPILFGNRLHRDQPTLFEAASQKGPAGVTNSERDGAPEGASLAS
jgi:hypothetical protein